MEVFIRKNKPKSKGFTTAVTLGKRPVKGDIGIEIEVEGNKFQKTDTPAMWGYHQDHSLRGEDNAEYVLKKPISFSDVPIAIEKLWKMFADYGSVLADSNRTSVHIHLNCQEFHFNRLTSMMALYFAVEEILVQWCGEHRVGNLFCLRAKDAPAIITQIKKFIQTDGKSMFGDNMHYAGMNAQALMKFGSLEFRSLRGVTDPDVILQWVAILERIYKLSAEFPDPRDVCALFSAAGPLSFYETVLGDNADSVREAIEFSHDDIQSSLYEGIRLAQDLCYCRDWGQFEAASIQPDPFGRSAMKIAQAVSDMQAQGYATLQPTPQPAPPLTYFNPFEAIPTGLGTVLPNHDEAMEDFLAEITQNDAEYWGNEE